MLALRSSQSPQGVAMSTDRTVRADADVPSTVDAGALHAARALVTAARGWPLEAWLAAACMLSVLWAVGWL
jgi:hypothetical protein